MRVQPLWAEATNFYHFFLIEATNFYHFFLIKAINFHHFFKLRQLLGSHPLKNLFYEKVSQRGRGGQLVFIPLFFLRLTNGRFYV